MFIAVVPLVFIVYFVRNVTKCQLNSKCLTIPEACSTVIYFRESNRMKCAYILTPLGHKRLFWTKEKLWKAPLVSLFLGFNYFMWCYDNIYFHDVSQDSLSLVKALSLSLLSFIVFVFWLPTIYVDVMFSLLSFIVCVFWLPTIYVDVMFSLLSFIVCVFWLPTNYMYVDVMFSLLSFIICVFWLPTNYVDVMFL